MKRESYTFQSSIGTYKIYYEINIPKKPMGVVFGIHGTTHSPRMHSQIIKTFAARDFASIFPYLPCHGPKNIRTSVNSSDFVNLSQEVLFAMAYNVLLPELRKGGRLNSIKKIIWYGHSLGSDFTLWLLNSIDLEKFPRHISHNSILLAPPFKAPVPIWQQIILRLSYKFNWLSNLVVTQTPGHTLLGLAPPPHEDDIINPSIGLWAEILRFIEKVGGDPDNYARLAIQNIKTIIFVGEVDFTILPNSTKVTVRKAQELMFRSELASKNLKIIILDQATHYFWLGDQSSLLNSAIFEYIDNFLGLKSKETF